MVRVLIRNVNVACESAFEVAKWTYDITGTSQRQYIHSALGGFGALQEVKYRLHFKLVSCLRLRAMEALENVAGSETQDNRTSVRTRCW